MKIFFDTEFTGLHKNTTLISIGLISEDGRKFYAELNDYDKSQVDEWIQKNVIDNLKFTDLKLMFNAYDMETYIDDNGTEQIKRYSFEMIDGKEMVSCELRRWLDQFDKAEWVSDICHYDFVLLIDLLYGHALKMPYGVLNSACHDINQDIATKYGIDEIQAFDMNREEIIENCSIAIEGDKHNALYDALVIKAIYESLGL